MSNFIKRSLTGFIYVAVLLGAIFCGSITFALLFCMIVGLSLWEFYGLMKHCEIVSLRRVVSTVAGMYLFLASFLSVSGYGDVFFLLYVVYIIYVFVSELYAKAVEPVGNWAYTLLGQLYCAGSFSLLNFIAIRTGDAGQVPEYGWLYVLALFVFIWLNDTGAFLIGSMFGKHPLFKRISPKKSWEGFFGGMLFAVLASLVFAYMDDAGIPWYKWLGLSVVVVIFGTWGDLVESLLKRTLGVKDSGKILPGHGGMLDRFDSVMLAIPAVFIYIRLFIQN